MTLRVGQVPGAAGSGTKFTTAKEREPKAEWTCPGCGSGNKGYWRRCLTVGCNHKRP